MVISHNNDGNNCQGCIKEREFIYSYQGKFISRKEVRKYDENSSSMKRQNNVESQTLETHGENKTPKVLITELPRST